MTWTAAACPWCGAPYALPRAWHGVFPPLPQPTCRCGSTWSYRVTTTTTQEDQPAAVVQPASPPPVRDQTDREAIASLEGRVDALTLELARMRREREEGAR